MTSMYNVFRFFLIFDNLNCKKQMKFTKGILLIISLVCLIATSWYMMTHPLWSYVPLFNYLGIWGLMLWLFRKILMSDEAGRKRLKLALISGVIFSVSFPPSPLFVGLLVGFVPMMMLERDIALTYKKAAPGRLFGYLFFGFWLWNILSTFWVANTAFFAGMIANIVNSILMTLPWLFFHILTAKHKWNGKYIILAAGWILFEYIHSNWDISWPWLTLGNGMTTCYPLIQWYEFTGYFGGSVWIWAINICLGLAMINMAQNKKLLYTGLLIFAIPSLLSLVLYWTYKEKGELIKVAAVQPNFEPHYQKFSVPEPQQALKIYEMTLSHVDSATKLIVMPETVLDPINMDDIYGDNPGLALIRKSLEKAPNAVIVAGVGGYHVFDSDPGRETVRNNGGTYYELYNAAILMKAGVDTVQEYHKSKFVPGAELFPFKKVLPFLRPLVKKLGGTYEGFAPQAKPSNFTFDGRKQVAPIICYESIYGGWVAEYVDQGAGLLAIITNDGWWDNTPGHLQHLAFARLRAIENRKDVVRSANTGTSCFINQRGDIRMETGYEEDAVISDNLHYYEGTTFYSRNGDYIILLVGIAMMLSLGINFLQKKD